jgi:hypothetical protein
VSSYGETVMFSGLEFYRNVRDPVDHTLNPQLPENPGTIHAVPRGFIAPYPTQPQFSGRFPEVAVCGADVRVVLPLRFDASDEDACPSCTAKAYSLGRI